MEDCGVSAGADGFCGGSIAALADDVRDGNDGSMICGQKAILPNAQSINGFSDGHGYEKPGRFAGTGQAGVGAGGYIYTCTKAWTKRY